MYDDGLGNSIEAYLLRAEMRNRELREMLEDAERRAREANDRANAMSMAIDRAYATAHPYGC